MNRSTRSHLGVATLSHPGMSGKENEDRFAVVPFEGPDAHPVLFAVISDGIGGHLAGEVAAQLTVDYILESVAESDGSDPLQIMESAVHTASQQIASRSASKADQAGMGATCACIWVEGDRLYTAHVGDSRIYLMRDGRLQRLTVDHSWVQEAIERGMITPEQARKHPNAHVLRRHLGSVELPDVDFRQRLSPQDDDARASTNQGASLLPGDILLACSDGLTDMVWDDEILRLITTRNSLKSAAEDLVARANERGGKDNITVILLGVPRADAPETSTKKGFLRNLLGV
jgi:serine/threonine protein phosphatase PrpC